MSQDPMEIEKTNTRKAFSELVSYIPKYVPEYALRLIDALGPAGIGILVGHPGSPQREAFTALVIQLEHEFTTYKMLED